MKKKEEEKMHVLLTIQLNLHPTDQPPNIPPNTNVP